MKVRDLKRLLDVLGEENEEFDDFDVIVDSVCTIVDFEVQNKFKAIKLYISYHDSEYELEDMSDELKKYLNRLKI